MTTKAYFLFLLIQSYADIKCIIQDEYDHSRICIKRKSRFDQCDWISFMCVLLLADRYKMGSFFIRFLVRKNKLLFRANIRGNFETLLNLTHRTNWISVFELFSVFFLILLKSDNLRYIFCICLCNSVLYEKKTKNKCCVFL